MLNSTEFILLHTTRYGEQSIILHTLSKEYGRKGFFVKSIPRRSATSLLFPLSILEADIVENGKSRLITARNPVSRHPLMSIRNDIRKTAISMFISEVLYRVVKEGMSDPELYTMCEKDILLLDALEADFSNFHIYFLMELANVLGFGPEPADLEPFLGEHTSLAARFMSLPVPEAMLVPMSGETRNEIAGELLKYMEYHTESAINVNSLKVLHEIFRTE